MPNKLIRGVYAALLTPRYEDGFLDEASFIRLLNFHRRTGTSRVVLNGATGEFCLTTPSELRRLVTLTVQFIGTHSFICGIGSSSVNRSCTLAQTALHCGAAAVLLPPPYFFPYSQDDIAEFLSDVASRIELPVLLYNLPHFTTPIEVETALKLLRDHPNIVGIKDSSGNTTILEAVTTVLPSSCRIVGSDNALIEAREKDICDAVISGVACVLPELIQSVFSRSVSYAEDCEKLHQLLQRLAPFPTPWGLKWLAEARGLAPAHFAQPLSRARLEQGPELQEWFKQWIGTRFPVAVDLQTLHQPSTL